MAADSSRTRLAEIATFPAGDRGRQSVCPRTPLKFPVRSKKFPVPPKKFPVRYFTWPDSSRLGDDGLPIGRAFIGFPVGAAKGAVHVAPTQRDAK